MFLNFEDRPSDSPFIERVWRSRSERGGPFVSIAAANFEMAVTRHKGRTFLTLRGPETKATRADCPADGEWPIRFRLGTFMPRLTPGELRDQNDVTLPGVAIDRSGSTDPRGSIRTSTPRTPSSLGSCRRA